MGVDFDSFLVCGWRINSLTLLKYLREQGITRENCEHYDERRDKKQKRNPCACGSECWSSHMDYNAPDQVRIVNVESTESSSSDFEECEFWIKLVDSNGCGFYKSSQVNEIMNLEAYKEIQAFVEMLGGDAKNEPVFESFYYIC